MAGAAADDKEMPRGVEKGHPVIAHQKDCADRVEHPTSKHPTEHRNRRRFQNGLHGGDRKPSQKNVGPHSNAVQSCVK